MTPTPTPHVHGPSCTHDDPAGGAMLRAVHAFLQAPAPDLEARMVAELQRGRFLAVVTYEPPLPGGHDGRATVPAGTRMHFRGRLAPDGKQLLAVYSDPAALAKDLPGRPVQTTVLDADQLVAYALHAPHAGAVLNPAGPYLELRAPELRMLRRA